MNITIADGKYTVVCDEVKGFRALRYGKEWRDLTGDNLVAELALEIEELRAALQSQHEIQFQVWRSTDSCMEFWSWDEADQYDYDQAQPENRRIIQIIKEG